MSTPLRDLITSIALDPTSKAAFADDPAAFLDDHGWSDLDGQDIGTALGALADESPIEHASRLGQIAAGDDLADGDDVDGGGLAGAITVLEAAAAALGEAPAPVADQLDDPDLALDRPGGPGGADDPLDGDPSLDIDGAHEPVGDVDTDADADAGGRDGTDPDDDLDGGLFRSDADREPTDGDPDVELDEGQLRPQADGEPTDGDPTLHSDNDLDRARFGPAADDEAAGGPEPEGAEAGPADEAAVTDEADGEGEPGASALDTDPLDALGPGDEHDPWTDEPAGNEAVGTEPEQDDDL